MPLIIPIVRGSTLLLNLPDNVRWLAIRGNKILIHNYIFYVDMNVMSLFGKSKYKVIL